MHDYKCNICGAPIGGLNHRFGHRHQAAPQDVAWMKEYRVIYVIGDQWFNASLSGVGFNKDLDEEIWSPPMEAHARYDDPDFDQSNAITVETDFPIIESKDTSGVQVRPTPWGFFFHNACWTLLQSAMDPHPINVQTFMNILRSLPCTRHVINWDHDYGGLFDMQYEPGAFRPGYRNWNRGFKIPYHRSDRPLTAWVFFHANPLDIAPLTRLIRGSIKERFAVSSGKAASMSAPGTFPESDCFGRLPMEIRWQILTYLSSQDTTNIRVASRSFANASLPQSYWASRFLPGNEYGYLFEARQKIHQPSRFYRDYRTLYMMMKSQESTHNSVYGFLNRKRVWPLIPPIVRLLITMDGQLARGTACATYYEPDLPKYRDEFSDIGPRSSDDDLDVLYDYCRTLFIRTARVRSRDIIAVDIYVIQFFDLQYVTGLRFHCTDGEMAELGYIIPEGEMARAVIRGNNTGDDNRLRGFCVACSEGGIHGLAFEIIGKGEASQWAGMHGEQFVEHWVVAEAEGFTMSRHTSTVSR